MLSAACVSAATHIRFRTLTPELKFPVVIERRSHPFPFRTRQLSSASPMILRGQLRGKVGRRRDNMKGPRGNSRAFFFFTTFHVALPHPPRGAPPRRGGVEARLENALPFRTHALR